MKKKINFFLVVIILLSCKKNTEFHYVTAFENSNGSTTATYEQVIDFYKKFSNHSELYTMSKIGITDSGEPLHLVHIKPEQPVKSTLKVLILNGIHPGEPDGIDASMLLAKKLATQNWKLPNEVELYIVPVYNIGGAKNRNSTSRVNQNGPAQYGFRGNALNYDLNRDFIKSDTQNSKAFYELYHQINPDVFIDTHVSNGADYQYTLTHLFTQAQQLNGELGKYIDQEYIPKLENKLLIKNLPITPYVNVYNQTPNKGFSQFLDTHRYSTGYTSLWNSLGLMIETHMLKPYAERVSATFEMLLSLIELSAEESDAIKLKRNQNFESILAKKIYALNYGLDTSKYKTFKFLGYKATTIVSEVTGKKRLKYKQDQPVTFPVNYYNYFKPTTTVNIPKAYIIPKAYKNLISLLKSNQIEMEILQENQFFEAEVYHISSYETSKKPYEGHYLHFNTKVRKSTEKIRASKGDVLVNTNQKGIRYLLETLEPEAVDSFFNWNFFDSILQQKEGYSAYVFDDLAQEILKNNTALKTEFETKKQKDSTFANNASLQLNWIYKHSIYHEKAYCRYPIYRILK